MSYRWCPLRGGWQGRKGTKTFRSWLRVTKISMFYFFAEPIEQNVHGNKGIYELVYFMKESKSLERFRKQAEECNKLIEGKSDSEIEKLVLILQP